MNATITYLKDYSNLSKAAADLVETTIRSVNGFCNLGLPTGRTPLGMYNVLRTKNINWSATRTFNLDEYLGIDENDPVSFKKYMRDQLHNYVNIDPKNIFFPDISYDQKIKDFGGLDLVVLGLGRNGHIAFNEPGSDMDSTTRIVDLDECTRKVNCKNNKDLDLFPTQAITMGVSTILASKSILLLVQGEEKLRVLKQSIWADPTPASPVSFLQTHYNLKVFYCD